MCAPVDLLQRGLHRGHKGTAVRRGVEQIDLQIAPLFGQELHAPRAQVVRVEPQPLGVPLDHPAEIVRVLLEQIDQRLHLLHVLLIRIETDELHLKF